MSIMMDFGQQGMSADATLSLIENHCRSLINGLDMKNLFLLFSDVVHRQDKEIGDIFEALVVSSLAVKFYLLHLSRSSVDFNSVFEPHEADRESLKDISVDFSQGISIPENEVFVDTVDSTNALVFNMRSNNAHHDIIIPTSSGVYAGQLKASFVIYQKYLESQRLVRRNSGGNVKRLIWLYLGSRKKFIGEPPNLKNYRNRFDNVVFIDCSRLCNSRSLDCITLKIQKR